MLVLTRKKYEVEEEIVCMNEANEKEYAFMMQITSEELKQIENILINKELIEMSERLGKMSAKGEDVTELQAKVMELGNTNQQLFEDICFKEHKTPFIAKSGEYYYKEMVGTIYDFFWKSFIENKTRRLNTMSTDLRKIIGK